MTVDGLSKKRDRINGLKQRYADRFGEDAPDLEGAAFWGSEEDLIKDALETGVPIVIEKLDEKVDL